MICGRKCKFVSQRSRLKRERDRERNGEEGSEGDTLQMETANEEKRGRREASDGRAIGKEGGREHVCGEGGELIVRGWKKIKWVPSCSVIADGVLAWVLMLSGCPVYPQCTGGISLPSLSASLSASKASSSQQVRGLGMKNAPCLSHAGLGSVWAFEDRLDD